ncbi:hypothetical protein BLNAU_12070 [Blattamonas nauphoetae]|uniref:Uncharacterized protein n=1 Tax=Blattamonas nauphoetae TaxID=2049346 RepID=A0ABQ9XRL4_9EUKA|nr:hypothetical protein BLNAU_12070 [Blattamonas nauphoetae]
MKMLETLIIWYSPNIRLALVKADLIPQIINTLNPQSHSFAEPVDLHVSLILIITRSVCLTTPDGLRQLEIEDPTEQQAVHETVLTQVLVPSEKYIWHLCVNHFSIIDGDQSVNFLELLARLLRISPYYPLTMDFVLHMRVLLTIPSCLTFFEYDRSIFAFLNRMKDTQWEWNEQRIRVRQMGNTVQRMLRVEGIEDVIEEKLRNDKFSFYAKMIVDDSIRWNNLQGMNLPYRW